MIDALGDGLVEGIARIEEEEGVGGVGARGDECCILGVEVGQIVDVMLLQG